MKYNKDKDKDKEIEYFSLNMEMYVGKATKYIFDL